MCLCVKDLTFIFFQNLFGCLYVEGDFCRIVMVLLAGMVGVVWQWRVSVCFHGERM